MQKNIFQDIPSDLTQEIFETLLQNKNIRIERIISYGQSSPPEGWYDQDEHEWILLLEGEALLAFEDKSEVHLHAGDYLNIPAHTKHKVAWTKEKTKTIWLAIFYN